MNKLAEVTLRPVTSEDLHKLLTWRNKDHIRKWFFHSKVLTMEDQQRWYSLYREKDDDEMFIIQEGPADIGCIAIYNIDKENKQAEIGRIIIGEDKYRSKGFAYGAGIIHLKYAFVTLNMERLYLQIFADNEVAFNLYRKLGFAKEGLLRGAILTPSGRKDIIVMGLLKREFLTTVNE